MPSAERRAHTVPPRNRKEPAELKLRGHSEAGECKELTSHATLKNLAFTLIITGSP